MSGFDVRVNPVVWKLGLAGLVLAILGLVSRLVDALSALSIVLIFVGILALLAAGIIMLYATWRDFTKPALRMSNAVTKGLVVGAGKIIHDESIRKSTRDEEMKKGV